MARSNRVFAGSWAGAVCFGVLWMGCSGGGAPPPQPQAVGGPAQTTVVTVSGPDGASVTVPPGASATPVSIANWENAGRGVTVAAAQKTGEISLPVAVTVFPDEVYRAPESWARRAYPKLIYFHEADRGGHFAAWEQPQLFAEELRAAFRSLR